ncbi:uncharacterized protein [Miscanthus floridulus]|uniref:uncharacterized protein n=1 Tax=Miscanthus floridulus TaxID=154761 RepID=UPI003457BC18
MDRTVLTWIYDNVSSDLLQSLMLHQFSARGAWRFLEGEFLGHSESRALLLETQFCNLRQGSMSITDYCRRLESMATSLGEFGDPIGDWQMVLTLLRGLNGQYHHMVSILKMHRPFPTFQEARTHFLLEEIEQEARPPSPPSALVAMPGSSSTPRQGHPGGPSSAPARQGGPPSVRPPAPASTFGRGQRNNRRRGRGGRSGGTPPSTGGAPVLFPSLGGDCADVAL